MTRHVSPAPRRVTPGRAGVAIAVLLIVGLPQPAQFVLAIGLLGWLPGWALVRLTTFGGVPLVPVLSIALSLATTTLAAMSLMYAGWWSAPALYGTLCLVILLCGRLEQEGPS